LIGSALAYLEPPLQSARIGGALRSWREAGAGSAIPLVLLHGIGSNSSSWAGQFAGLAGDRRVIAWNAPGYPGSDNLAPPWPSARDYGAALLALLDHLGIARCIVIGQSLGAIVAAAVAVETPSRVAALMLASPASGYAAAPGGDLPPAVAARFAEVAALGPRGLADKRAGRLLTERASAAARELVWRAMSEVTVDGYRQASRMLACADIKRDAARLTVPTIVAWGAEDLVTPPAACRAVAAAVPAGVLGGRAVEVAALGHGFATEGPAAFNAVVRQLLALAP
jgi:pimeloyl-ACP methyl ester carboxylesterase